MIGTTAPTDVKIFVKAIDDLLTRHHPMRRAECAAARQRQQAAKAVPPDECHATATTGGSLPSEVRAEKHEPQDHDTTRNSNSSRVEEVAAAQQRQAGESATEARPTSRTAQM